MTVRPHPNAERLEIVPVGGWQAVVKKGQFKRGDRAVYVEPDYTVPTSREEFAFMAKPGRERHRLKAVRLRGELSYGLLIPVPAEIADKPVGANVMDDLGIARWEPEVKLTMADELPQDQWPATFSPKFDVESYEKFPHVIEEGEPVVVTEKIHGCLLHDARISMADGSRRRLGCINSGDMVLGMDSAGKIVPTRVLNKFNNGVGGKWVRLRGPREAAGRGNSFFSITCTDNHRFWNPKACAYVSAGDIRVGDPVSIIRSEMALTPIQEQVLLGKLLGDGSYRDAVTTAAVHFSHKTEDRDYLEWTCQALGDLDSGTREDMTSGYGTPMVRGRSIGSAWIKEKFCGFFDAQEPKRVPAWVADCLTPIALAFWYMDDGSLAHADGQEDRASIATCAFSEACLDVLIKGMSKLGIAATKRMHDGFWRIYFSADNAERLFLIVAPYIPPCMQRKLPERYRGGAGWIPSRGRTYKPSVVTQCVSEIVKCENVYARHDIETETHNFFANGILVHNSNARYVFVGGVFHQGSRQRWLIPDGGHIWARAAAHNPQIKGWCEANPGTVLYGEVYGNVQSLTYGLGKGEVRFIAFAASLAGQWRDQAPLFDELTASGIPCAPILYAGPFDHGAVKSIAEQDSKVAQVAGHMMEGVVVVPERERFHGSIGRVAVKHISNRYWEMAD